LFKPKGKGFIELAVLRTGEVLGEMAFFDDKGQKRSCSAEAIVTTEVIEVSFLAFSKALENLNPWFKSIITTLAERLRKTNSKVKELETNSVGGGYGTGTAEYRFIQNADIVKFLSTIFLVFKAHGETKDGQTLLHMNTLKFYAQEIYNGHEAKLEMFLELLKNISFIKRLPDKDGFPKILGIENVGMFRSLLVFYNTERNTADEKKFQVSPKCELFLDRIFKKVLEIGQLNEALEIEITPLIQEFKARNVIIDQDDLVDAIKYGLCTEPVVGKTGAVTVKVIGVNLQDKLPCIHLQNAILKMNQSKAPSKY
jgi:CRP/FNR family cyclic AMP-dependent transcriptional regulator